MFQICPGAAVLCVDLAGSCLECRDVILVIIGAVTSRQQITACLGHLAQAGGFFAGSTAVAGPDLDVALVY